MQQNEERKEGLKSILPFQMWGKRIELRKPRESWWECASLTHPHVLYLGHKRLHWNYQFSASDCQPRVESLQVQHLCGVTVGQMLNIVSVFVDRTSSSKRAPDHCDWQKWLRADVCGFTGFHIIPWGINPFNNKVFFAVTCPLCIVIWVRQPDVRQSRLFSQGQDHVGGTPGCNATGRVPNQGSKKTESPSGLCDEVP